MSNDELRHAITNTANAVRELNHTLTTRGTGSAGPVEMPTRAGVRVEPEEIREIRERAEAEIAAVRRERVAERRALAETKPTPRMDEIRGETPDERDARRAEEATWHIDRPGAGLIQARVRELYDRAVCDWLEGTELTAQEWKAATALSKRTAAWLLGVIQRDSHLWALPLDTAKSLNDLICERAEVFQIANRTADIPVHLLEFQAERWAWLDMRDRAPELFFEKPAA